MKKTFLLLLLLLPVFGFSQLSGNYIIGTSQPAPYNNIVTAINKLNNDGLTNSVVFLLDNDYTLPADITDPIVINQLRIVGSNTNSTFTIKPNVGKTITITASAPQWNGQTRHLFKINGADNIIVDGSNNGTSTKDLTLRSIHPNNYANNLINSSLVWIGTNSSNSADNNIIKNVIFEGYSANQTTATSVGIIFSNSDDVTNAEGKSSTGNQIVNCEFTKIKTALVVNGSTSGNNLLEIKNNIFGSSDSSKYLIRNGIKINNANNFKINNNTIKGIYVNVGDGEDFSGIYISGNSTNGTIEKNNISNITKATGQDANGIFLGSTSNNSNIVVVNNIISNISSPGTNNSDSGPKGISLKSGGNYKIYHNTVVMNTTANVQSQSISASLYVFAGLTNLDIRNNIFTNTSTASNRFTVYSKAANTAYSFINYNNYFSAGSFAYLGSSIANYAAWKTATNNKDQNSVVTEPKFVSASDFHLKLNTTPNETLIGSNALLATVPFDFDNDARTTPTIGADEYLTCTSLTAPTGIVQSATNSCINGNSVLLTTQGGTPAGTTYQWGTGSVSNANAIAGQTGASITVSPNLPTTYWVRRFSNDACATYSPEASILVIPSDKTTFGNGQWIGYVYSNYTNYSTTPDANDANYQGFVTEPSIFDQNIPNGTAFRGTNTYLCNAPTTQYFVRYKMKMTLTAGTYNFTVGGDDGYRLKIDGVAVTTINNWGEHSYTTSSVLKVMTAAEHTFELEYFNGPNLAHVSFSYGKVQGDPTVFGNNVWNVYGFNSTNVDFNNLATQASYSGYYVQGTLGVNTQDLANNGYVRTGAPSESAGWNGAPINASAYTITHKRKGFPCGTYQLVMDNWDDDAVIYLDENPVAIWSQNGYSGGHPAADRQVGTFKLGPDSKLEVRLKQTGGDGNLKLSIINIPVIYNNGWSSDPANSAVVINSDFTVSNDLTVCSCTVKAGKKVTINSGKALNVIENVTVETGGNIYVKNNGSLVQIKDYATFTGDVNSFTMERNTTSMILYDFTYWGSPVAAQNLKTFSPKTLADKYFSFNGTNWVIEAPTTTSMTPGRGYIIRAPQAWNNTITNGGYSSNSNPGNATPANANGTFAGGVFQGVFIGKANAGDITVPLLGSAGSSNLFGNPYASPISTEEFMNANVGKTDGNFYFWTHKTPISRNPDTSGHYNYADSDYAMINKTGGTATSPIAAKPSANVAAGQGFFVNTKAANTNIVFKNSMRVQGGGNNGEFYRTASNTQNDKYWISISNGTAYNEFLVGYMEGATNAMEDNFDGISYSAGAAMLYTVIDGNKLAIQGRQYPFNNTDAVPVGYKVTAAGQFTISINKKEGAFENGQAIYLYDTTTNEYHDLTAGDFVFNSAAGTFDSRFEMRYTNETLGVDTPVVSNSDIVVYKSGNQISVKAKNFTIDGVQVYDITGKSLYAKKGINNSEFSTASLNAATQVLVVKVTLYNNQTVSKKVIMN